jgi:hypothetical protein
VASVHILYRWYGFGPGSPIKIEYQLTLKRESFVGSLTHSDAKAGYLGAPPSREDAGSRVVTKRNIAIPREAIRSFLKAVLGAPAEKAMKYMARLDHTDDYPSLAFDLRGRAGRVIIGTISQPTMIDGHVTRAPWAIFYSNRIYVMSTCEIDLALEILTQQYLTEANTTVGPFVAMGSPVRPPEHC